MATISYTTDFPSKLERVNKMMNKIAKRKTEFLSMFLKLNEPVDALKYEWVDKTLVRLKDKLSAALTSSSTTTITVASGTNAPKRYVDGYSLIYIEDEILLVSSTIT